MTMMILILIIIIIIIDDNSKYVIVRMRPIMINTSNKESNSNIQDENISNNCI